MTWPDWITLAGLGGYLAGIVLVIWSLFQGGVLVLGVALMIAGYLLQLLGAFIDLKCHGV
jgi:hypothetical protein